jgi:hypothetical protein
LAWLKSAQLKLASRKCAPDKSIPLKLALDKLIPLQSTSRKFLSPVSYSLKTSLASILVASQRVALSLGIFLLYCRSVMGERVKKIETLKKQLDEQISYPSQNIIDELFSDLS